MNKIYANGNYFFVQLGTDITPSSDAKGNVIVNINHDNEELLLSSTLTVNTSPGDFGIYTLTTIELDGDFTSQIIPNVSTFKFTYLNAGLVSQVWSGLASSVTYVPITEKTFITPDFQGFTPVSTNGSNMIGNQKLYSFELSYSIASPKIGLLSLPLSTLADESGIAYTQATWEAFYLANSGFNPASGGSGAGDMTKSVYDTNDDGIVNSADKEMIQVINKTGSTIVKGSIVYLKSTSSSGTHPEILLASASTEATSSKTIGAVYDTISNDGLGYVVTSGEVRNAITNSYSIGTKLWLSNTPGLVQTTPPTQPSHSVFIGTVTRSQATNGRILYAIQNGYELDELHDVLISYPIDNDVLVRENGLWKNKQLNNLSFIPQISSLEVFRGRSFRFDSTTVDTYGGINSLNNASASAVAPSWLSTNFSSVFTRLRYYASIVSTGRVTSIRSTDLQWFIGRGFRFNSTWKVADTAFGSTCQNFHGLIGITTEIAVGGANLTQVSTLTNCIFIGNDGSDTNLQVMHNDASGTCTKIDLGVDFPANRTSGSIMTTMYSCEIYNQVNSSDVKYKVINLETNVVAHGTITTNLPTLSQGLAIQSARVMGSALTNTGQWEQHKWGCSDITL